MPRKKKSKRKKSKKNKQESNEELLKQISELKVEIERLKQEKSQSDNVNQVLAQLIDTVSQLKQAIEAGAASAEKLINNAKGLVIAIANDPRIAKEIGYQTGINIATLQNTAQRIIEGKVSHQEVICAIDNIWNAVKGYFVGDQAYKELVEGIEGSKEEAKRKVADMVEDYGG